MRFLFVVMASYDFKDAVGANVAKVRYVHQIHVFSMEQTSWFVSVARSFLTPHRLHKSMVY